MALDDDVPALQIERDRERAALEAQVKYWKDRARQLYDALDLLRGMVKDGGVPRYYVTPGAALNAVVEETVDPALRTKIDE